MAGYITGRESTPSLECQGIKRCEPNLNLDPKGEL